LKPGLLSPSKKANRQTKNDSPHPPPEKFSILLLEVKKCLEIVELKNMRMKTILLPGT
jgi:hypothetical protein